MNLPVGFAKGCNACVRLSPIEGFPVDGTS
jgi:hypothetical protein